MDKKNYKRISCDIYDEFEILAMRKEETRIKYYDDDSKIVELITTIQTLQTDKKEEFLITLSGIKIRLDKVISFEKSGNLP